MATTAIKCPRCIGGQMFLETSVAPHEGKKNQTELLCIYCGERRDVRITRSAKGTQWQILPTRKGEQPIPIHLPMLGRSTHAERTRR